MRTNPAFCTTLLRVFYFFEPKNTPAVSCSLVNNHKNAMKVDFCNIRLLKTGGGSWYNACVIGRGAVSRYSLTGAFSTDYKPLTR